jgi:dienelactone hydrolase
VQHGTVVDAVRIPDGTEMLDADLHVPTHARGLEIYAHGSGSRRFSRRNRQVAEFLNAGEFATLLLDLLTPAEESVDVRTGEYRFDIPILGRRVVAATDWATAHPVLGEFRIGYFGASTGAAAALIAAAERPHAAAVVSRGGRPELAGQSLARVRTPTLLIVGGDDEPVIELNQAAMQNLRATAELAVVHHATHLFEEAGALEQVQRLALDWFARYVPREPQGRHG